jgi:hypothetical protein
MKNEDEGRCRYLCIFPENVSGIVFSNGGCWKLLPISARENGFEHGVNEESR